MKTLEQIEEDYKKLVYGTCTYCNKDFIHGEKSVRISHVCRYSSHGFPDKYERTIGELHEQCLVNFLIEQNICSKEHKND